MKEARGGGPAAVDGDVASATTQVQSRPSPESPPPPQPRVRHAHRLSRLPVVLALLTGLVVGSLLLRVEGMGRWLWMDEGISVGIASHRLWEIPGVLRMDGSPPLYYVVLHAWMALFGTSEFATHALSLSFALALVPVSLWAGWSLFGRRAGWILAVLAATNGYVTEHSRETRMYTLVALLALVVTATFLHAFVFGRARYLPVFVGSLVLLLYTHNWGLWFTAGLAAALLPCLHSAKDRPGLAVAAAGSFGAVGVLYLPWLPTLISQVRHTGAPWSAKPLPREAVSALSDILGDPHERVLLVLFIVAGAALWHLWRRRSQDVTAATASTALVVLIAVTVGVAWLGAQAQPSWANRYLIVCLPAVLMLAALGLARAGAQGVVALALIVVIWTQPLGRLSGLRPTVRADEKAAEKLLGEAVSVHLAPGDLVVAIQMEEVPVLDYYLPEGVRFATPMGLVADARMADWRNAITRLENSTPETHLRPLIDDLAVGANVLLVCELGNPEHPELTWFELMAERCQEWEAALSLDARLAPVTADGSESWSSQFGRTVLLLSKTTA